MTSLLITSNRHNTSAQGSTAFSNPLASTNNLVPSFLGIPIEAALYGFKSLINSLVGETQGSGGMDKLGSMPLFKLALSPAHLNSEQLFVNYVAGSFQGSQDAGHNALLEYLLRTKYQPDNQELRPSSTEKKAYQAMFYPGSQLQIGNALHWVRNAAQATNASNGSFFIRDYVQVNSSGGTSSSPLVVEEKIVRDGLVGNNSFAKDFENLRAKVNRQIQVMGATGQINPLSQIAHRDAIQLIPSTKSTRFVGDKMQNVVIRENNIHSNGKLQGIFASDGAFRNIEISNNKIDVGGKHTIAVNGLLSGKIQGNEDLNGNTLPASKINLRPVRVGGGANIYILSFNNKSLKPDHPDYYAYEPLTEGSQRVTDSRTQKVPGASNWGNVDMSLLRSNFQSWAGNRNITDVEFKAKLPQLLRQAGGHEV